MSKCRHEWAPLTLTPAFENALTVPGVFVFDQCGTCGAIRSHYAKELERDLRWLLRWYEENVPFHEDDQKVEKRILALRRKYLGEE